MQINDKEKEDKMDKIKGKIVAVCRSKKKGTVKKEIAEGLLIEDFGLEKDAHSGKWHRQISLLGVESINKMKGKGFKITHGDFAENLTVKGLILYKLPIGAKLKIGEAVQLEVTQIGKKDSYFLEIDGKRISSIMTKEGIFTRVLKGGKVKAGDEIEVVSE